MKKHYLITLIIPALALASCAPATPDVVQSTPIHTHIPHTITKPNVTPTPIKTPTKPEISPTHGIPGQPC